MEIRKDLFEADLVEIRKDLIEADCGSVVFCPRMAAHALATSIIKINRS